MSTKVKLVLLEEEALSKNILDTPNSTVEFSIIVWNDQSKIVFEKKGKVAKEKLSDALTFETSANVEHSFILDLNVIINNKSNSFITVSPDNTVLQEVSNATGVNLNSTSSFTTTEEPTSTVLLYVVSEEGFNTYVKENVGKLQVTVEDELTLIKQLDLDAKRLAKRLEIIKKQKFGESFASDKENEVLGLLANENTYSELQNLLTAYQTSGIGNLSDHRKNIHTALKGAVDNLVVLKGRLGSLIQTSVKNPREGSIRAMAFEAPAPEETETTTTVNPVETEITTTTTETPVVE